MINATFFIITPAGAFSINKDFELTTPEYVIADEAFRIACRTMQALHYNTLDRIFVNYRINEEV